MDTISDYFEGAIPQHLVRGQRLLERIPKNLPREFQLLAQTCEKEIIQRLHTLDYILNDPQMRLPYFQPERLRKFRRIIADLNHYETIGIATLERHNDHDVFMNKLIERICHEINYPLLPPVVSSLSQNYFHIYHGLNLMFVPLSEGDFLLHLPDLYHELAHPFMYRQYDPRVASFQNAFFQAHAVVLQYIYDEQQKEERQKGRRPDVYRFYLRQWEKSWKDWLIEFFCDLFAVVSVGPAFAWSHLHLFAKLGSNPFYFPNMVPSTHPPDAARMWILLYTLKQMGFSNDAECIKQHWNDFITISGANPEPEYDRCFPPQLLNQIADLAFKGTVNLKCRVAKPNTNDSIYTMLNQAWEEFWTRPGQYADWERNAHLQLQGMF